MLKIRIIPCLDVKDGRVVKGINFEQLRDAGHHGGAQKALAVDDVVILLRVGRTEAGGDLGHCRRRV